MAKNDITKNNKYTLVPLDIAWFQKRHKIPFDHKTFIVKIIDKIDVTSDDTKHLPLMKKLISMFKLRLIQTKSQSWIDYTLNEQDCYCVQVKHNLDKEMYEIVLESEVKKIKKNE